MKRTTTPRSSVGLRAAVLAAGLLVGGTAFAACGSGSNATPAPAATTASGQTSSTASEPGGTTARTADAGSTPVLPVNDNPIDNASTIQDMSIVSVLVENNVDEAGNAATDHLEISLANTGTTELAAFEVFYTFSDPATNITESYYARLPDTFTIPAGERRVAHFDNTGATDHFPVSNFSLYYTDANALDVTVTVSAFEAAVQTTTVQKDAGGPETAD